MRAEGTYTVRLVPESRARKNARRRLIKLQHRGARPRAITRQMRRVLRREVVDRARERRLLAEIRDAAPEAQV